MTTYIIAAPSAAVGPGSGAITWVESTRASALTVLAVMVLRAAATTASSAVGGCGGLFVPFLAIGDLGGRVFAPSLDVPADLAGAAGAASGISGGYHLPFTAVALVLGQGGPLLAMLTCLKIWESLHAEPKVDTAQTRAPLSTPAPVETPPCTETEFTVVTTANLIPLHLP